MCDVPFHDNSPPLDVLNDQIENFSESNNEASPLDSELVSSEVMGIVIPKVGGIDDDIPLTIKYDNLREKLSNVHLLIANIEALKDNPTQSSELLTKSTSTSLNSFLEETSTFHNSLPEFENFYFDLGEISSGSTTTHSDISLSEYESFIFEEFVDELAHIISSSEYDRFYFWNLPNPGELMSVLNCGIRESLSTTLVNLPIEDDYSPLLAYVVWIFVAYLTLSSRLTMSQNKATMKTILLIHMIHRVFHNNILVVPAEKLLQQEQWAYLSTHPSKRLTSFCYDDDDDYNSAITPVLSTEEPIDSLSMGDEHLDIIPATESDEVIKSSVEGLVPIP
nr:hypothetical protein [Tanacetum cinerariifolium]